MQKNVSGQLIYVYAYSSITGDPVTGDAANITGQISKDGAALASTNDTNPAEVGGGLYAFTATQAETNADTIAVIATSSTSNVLVLGSPQVIVTVPEYFADLGINSDGDILNVVSNDDMRGTDSAYTGTPPTAAEIVNEWESQSQADPTGFHVNVKEVNGTSVSGPDDFKATGFSTLTAAGVWQEDLGELALTGTMAGRKLNNIEDDTNELQGNQGDWATATGFSTHSAADVRTEMDSNSTQLAAIVEDTGTTLPSTLTSIAGSITTIDGIVDQILIDTAEIGAAGAGLTEAGGTGDQLTAITGIILDAAGIRSAIGMAAADLDTQLGVITADTNELQTDWANGGRLDTLLDTAASGGGGGSSSVQGRVLEANIVSEVLQAEIVSG